MCLVRWIVDSVKKIMCETFLFCFLKIVSVAEELSAVEQCSDVVEGRDLHHGHAANKSAGSVDMMR